MKNFKSVISYELTKIKSRKKYYVIPLIEIIIILGIGLLSLTKIPALNILISIPNLSSYVLPVFLTFFIPITIFMLVSEIFSSEFENNSIKNILLRPVSRLTVYAGKAVSIAIYIFINLMLIYVSTFLVVLIFTGSTYNASAALLSYILSILPMCVLICFGCLIACKINSSSMTMFLLVIIYVFMSGISIYSSKIGSVLFTTYFSYYKLFLGNIMPVGNIINTLFLLLSCMVIFFAGGYILFEKKEV